MVVRKRTVLSIFLLFSACVPRIVYVTKYISELNQDYIEKEGVRISVSAKSSYDLYMLYGEQNPYFDENGSALTVFEINVKNNRKNPIEILPENIYLIDSRGNQYLPYDFDYFKSRFPRMWESEYILDEFWGVRVQRYRKTIDYYRLRIVQETLFRGGKVFPGSHLSGVVVFKSLPPDVESMILWISEVALFDDKGEKIKNLEFKFPFRIEVQKVMEE